MGEVFCVVVRMVRIGFFVCLDCYCCNDCGFSQCGLNCIAFGYCEIVYDCFMYLKICV